MDWELIAGVQPPVDEDAVMAEVAEYIGEGHREKQLAAHKGGLPVKEPWRIENIGQADWAMRRLEEAQRQARQYRDEIALWQDALGKIEHAGEWFEERLKEWAIGQRNKDRKTFPLAHGTVATRESRIAIEVVDEELALEWARAKCVLAIKTKESFLVSVAKEHGARLAQVILGFSAIDKTSGEQQVIEIEGEPVLDPEKVAALQAKMGDGWLVEPMLAWAVVDNDDEKVPGLDVRPGAVTASVSVSNL